MRRPMLLSIAAATLAFLAGPGSALASTVKTVPIPDSNLRDVVYTGAPFEVNEVTISETSHGNLLVTDPSSIIVASAGCTLQFGSNGHAAICRPGFGNQFFGVEASLGDQNDSASVPADLEGGAVLDGGTGFDRLTGSPRDDRIDGGPAGEAVMDGGKGADAFRRGAVTYESRSAPVRVKLDGFANDGGAGEGDDVGAGVTKVTGGFGDDHLIDGGALTITPAAVTLEGGPGNDFLNGIGLTNLLLAGTGADEVVTKDDSFDAVDCGDDSDLDVTIADDGDQLRRCP
jgi:hypothetical protein